MRRLIPLGLMSGLLVGPAAAADWPGLHGPTRDGQSSETGFNWAWTDAAPAPLWKHEVGAGFAGVAAAQGTVYVYHRVEGSDVLEALAADSGKRLWKASRATTFRDDYQVGDGPRCTPLVGDDAVFAYGADGILTAYDRKTGKEVWSRHLTKDYQPPRGFFGVGAGPALIADRLIVNVGGKGAALVALEPATGKEIWKTGDDAASYSSVTAASLNGKQYAVAFTRAGLLLVDAAGGELVATYPWRSRLDASVNAATPLVHKDSVFLSASYGTGAVLLKLQGKMPEELWSGDKSLSCQFNTPVKVGDYFYGIHGRQEGKAAALRCIAWQTGKVLWEKERFGCAHIIAVDGGLLIVNEEGELIRCEANPKGYKEVARVRVLDGLVRAAPALADGRLFLRNESRLVALPLK